MNFTTAGCKIGEYEFWEKQYGYNLIYINVCPNATHRATLIVAL